jgi:Thioesterase-like superfamily
MALESTVLTLGEKSATFHHRLKNVATGDIAMSTEFKCVLLDLEKRQATSIPDDIRAAAAQLIGAGTGSEVSRSRQKWVKVRSHGGAMARPVYLQQRIYLVTAGTALECHEPTFSPIGIYGTCGRLLINPGP